MKPRKSIEIFICICLLGLLLTGCQGVTPIKIKTLKPPKQTASGQLLVGDLAKNQRREYPNSIGYHTFTVFGLKTVPIHAAKPPGMQDAMTEHIKHALTTAGYDVKVVPPGVKPDGPILRGEIRKFWFSSYWWLWPVTIVGGEIKLQLILEDADGNLLWENKCKGGATTVLPSFANVDFLVKSAATKVCNKVIRAVTSDEFIEALNK